MKVTAIIKASNISNHFPGRYATCIKGVTLLEHIVHQVRQSEKIDSIVVTTSDNQHDDSLANQAESLGLPVFRGPYTDSLGRIHGAAQLVDSDIFIRVLGHYPLISIPQTETLVDSFAGSKFQYGYNEHSNGLIIGTGVDIVTRECLEKANKDITDIAVRVNGMGGIRSIIPDSQTLVIQSHTPRPQYRVSLAVPEDVDMVNELISTLPDTEPGTIISYLDTNPFLVKYAQQNIASHSETSRDKLLLFPDKVSHIINRQHHTAIDPSYPISVELSLTNRCNLNCVWCSDSDLRQRAMDDIEFKVLERLFQDLAQNGTRGIVIEGGGEPTLYPRFDDVVDSCKNYGLQVGLITNGVRPIKPETLHKLEWMRVSLDAATSDQFIRSKGRDAFETVVDNIRKAAETKQDSPLIIGVGYVLTNSNIDQLESLVRTLSRLNVDYIQIRPVIDHPEFFPNGETLSYLEQYERPNFAVNTHNLLENNSQGNQSLPCHAHSLSTVIAADGSVFLCGRLNKYDWFEPMGNINTDSFHNIWHGEKRRTQSEQLTAEYCGQWCPECRMTKYNVVLNNIRNIKTTNFI